MVLQDFGNFYKFNKNETSEYYINWKCNHFVNEIASITVVFEYHTILK